MNILKSMCRLTVVLILTLIVVSVADAKTFYVSKNGSDKNNGLKSRNAFLTIRKAAQSAKNNDVVIVDSGTYADAVDVTGKTKKQQLVFQVAQSATVVISGPVKIVNSNNIVFNGFQFAVPSDALSSRKTPSIVRLSTADSPAVDNRYCCKTEV